MLFAFGFFRNDLTLKICALSFAATALIVNLIVCLRARTKYKFTKRAKSLFIVTSAVFFSVNLAIVLPIKNDILAITLSIGSAAFYPLFILAALALVNPYYEKKNAAFVKKMSEALAKKNIVKIGITGSYGKTSCKNILKAMLEKKFVTAASKENFNTPMGLAIAIKELKGDEEVFIAEMGARRRGDIAFLADMIKPDIGIVTGVSPQHLKTFKSVHNIYIEKQMLAKSVEESGLAIFNANDRASLKMFKEHKGAKFRTAVNKRGDVYAENLTVNADGCKFDLVIENEVLGCRTKLLGKHNVINITMCACVAHYLGVENDKIVEAIRELKPVPHRLEYFRANGIHILDDSYNANMNGIKSALECLSSFDARKVVLAQGIVELGKKQAVANREVGRLLSRAADVVMLTGSNKKRIKEGLTLDGFSGKIYEFPTLKKTQAAFKDILTEGDVLLLQNDLPDIF